MTNNDAGLSRSVAEMRLEFDRAFSIPVQLDTGEEKVALLQLKAGAVSLAVRAGDIKGMEKTPSLVLLPGADPAFLGLGTLRGALVAVYHLSSLLGGSAARAETNAGRWMLLLGQGRDLGIVFDEFEGMIRVDPAAIQETGGELAKAEVLTHAGSRGLLDTNALIQMLQRRRDEAGIRED